MRSRPNRLGARILSATAVAAIVAVTAFSRCSPTSRVQITTREFVAVDGSEAVDSIPSEIPVTRTVRDRVARSVVRIHAQSCTQRLESTGWVSAPGLVTTSAHGVAGSIDPVVETEEGARVRAKIVAFDPVLDVAILSVARLSTPPLATAAVRGAADFAVFGHPNGGSLRIAPARTAVGAFVTGASPDIYGEGSYSRRVVHFSADLTRGDSGAPLVDATGRVVAMTYAIDSGRQHQAYAVDRSSIATVAAGLDRSAPRVSAGRCGD